MDSHELTEWVVAHVVFFALFIGICYVMYVILEEIYKALGV